MNGRQPQQHWSDDQLVNHLYELGPSDQHFGECEDCRERWLHLMERRVSLRTCAEPPPEFFVQQRARIMRRIEGPSWRQLGVRLATATAGLAVVSAGLLFWSPDRHSLTSQNVPSAALSDAQMDAEIATLSSAPVARAAKPMDALLND